MITNVLGAQMCLYVHSLDTEKVCNISLQEVCDLIKNGEQFQLKNKIQHLRSLTDKKEIDHFKKTQLPLITTSMLSNHRGKENRIIEAHTGLIQIDFDKNISDPVALKQRLEHDHYTLLAFISPSGKGVKLIVQIPANAETHLFSFIALENYYQDNYQQQIDPSCKDMARSLYLSWDEDVFINEDAQVFTKQKSVKKQEQKFTGRRFTDTSTDIGRCISQLNKDITVGYDKWLRIGFALASHLGDAGRDHFHAISSWSPSYDSQECDLQYKYCCLSSYSGSNRITIKTLFQYFKDEGIDITPSEANRDWKSLVREEEKQFIENRDNAPENGALNEIAENIKKIYEISFNRDGEVVIELIESNLYALLLSWGFQSFDLGNDYFYVLVKNNIVERITTKVIKTTFFRYLKQLPDDYLLTPGVTVKDIEEEITRKSKHLFEKAKLELLEPEKPIEFMQDGKKHGYSYHSNGFVTITENGWSLTSYSEMPKCIWRSQIIQRDFVDKPEGWMEKSDFIDFIDKVSGSDTNRMASLLTMIGYAMNNNFETKLKALILTDTNITDNPEGRSGKSILGKAIAQITPTVIIPGKSFNYDEKFRYQLVNEDTLVVVIDDLKPKFDIENLFNDITEFLAVEYKGGKTFKIRVKIVITSNRTIKINGGSAKDRVIEFEVANFFYKGFSPEDFYGKRFFESDWDNMQWQSFYNFMYMCKHAYYKHGLCEAPTVNLDKRRLIEQTDEEFVQWLDNKFENGELLYNCWISMPQLKDEFVKDFEDIVQAKKIDGVKFTKWMKNYYEQSNHLVRFDNKMHLKRIGSAGGTHIFFEKR